MNSGLRINNIRWIITTTSVLALFCFLYTITPDFFNIGLSGVSWLYIILCFVFFSIRRGTLRKPLYFSGCFIYSLISIILQTIHGEYASAFWTGVSLLLVPCIFVSEVKDKKVFFKLIDCVIYSGMIVCFFGIAEALTGFNVFYSILNTVGVVANYNSVRLGMVRIISFTSHAISYAAYIMFLLSMVIYRIRQISSRRKKRSYSIIYIIAVVNAVLTLSRSAIMAIILCQLLLLLKLGVQKTVKKILVTICVTLALSLIVQIMVPDFDFISQFLLMMIGVFNKSVNNIITDAVGANANGIGERLLLYKWVWDSMEGSMIVGHGGGTAFAYNYTISGDIWNLTHTKESIEVQYLYQLYHYGMVGMLSQIIMYISLLIAGIKSYRKSKRYCEGKLTFDYVFLVTLAVYFLLFFAVNQATERHIFNMFLYLFFAYSTNRLFMENEGLK